jgi:hypothetical protein
MVGVTRVNDRNDSTNAFIMVQCHFRSDTINNGCCHENRVCLSFKLKQARFQMFCCPFCNDPAEISRTCGESIKAPTTSAASDGALVTILTTPSGKPAAAKASTISSYVRGHISLAFRIRLFPQASGAAMARTPKTIGPFQGAMPRMTPTGCFNAVAMHPGLSEGIIAPVIWVVRAAASCRTETARAMCSDEGLRRRHHRL